MRKLSHEEAETLLEAFQENELDAVTSKPIASRVVPAHTVIEPFDVALRHDLKHPEAAVAAAMLQCLVRLLVFTAAQRGQPLC